MRGAGILPYALHLTEGLKVSYDSERCMLRHYTRFCRRRWSFSYFHLYTGYSMIDWLARPLARQGVRVARAAAVIPLAAILSVFVPGSAGAEAAAPSCPAATGSDYSGQDLTNRNFAAMPPGTLRGANFTNARLSGAAFDGQDLTGAVFEGADLGPAKGPVSFTQATLDRTCFVGANLDQTDFSYAAITCADFSGTSLLKADFGPRQDIRAGDACRSKFVGATLDVRLIGDDLAGKSNWSKSDFTDANFHNALPATFSLAGKDITGAILAGTALIGIDMTGANLTSVDFSRADISNANLTGATLNGARLILAKAGGATFACVQAYGNGGAQTRPDGTACPTPPTSTAATSSADFSLATLKNADFTAAILDHAAFQGANLNRAVLAGARLEQANLQSSPVTGHGTVGPANVQFADFSSANLTNAQLASVNFSGGILTKAIFDNTALDHTEFTNATMPSSSFKGATLQSVNFSSAILQSADFSNATAQAPSTGGGFGANFQCSQLGGAVFSNSNIQTANFSNAVMPAADQCCSSNTGGTWCGMVDATQSTYPGVTFPVLLSPVTCPSGDVAICRAAQWQLSPDWTTTGCSPDRTLLTMWSKPNCGGTPGDQVTFKDARLKACILESLPGQTEVLTATAQQIRQVSCPGRGITDIGGLEAFTALERLDLSNNALTTFTLAFPGGARSKLTSLDVASNALATLDLSRHPSLLMLRASHNQLSSIALNANASLIVIEAAGNRLKTFDLAIHTGLTYADLSNNTLTSVLNEYSGDLGQSAALAYLDLSGNALTTIGGVAALAATRTGTGGGPLQSLSLACNPSFDCASLGVSDGTRYPAIASSRCVRYDAASRTWTPLAKPDCTP